MNDTTFSSLGIAPSILEILSKLNFTVPTPIQHQSIPVGLAGKDVIGIAQTGTGKTFAFGIPMIQRLAQHKGQGLIIVPTRELALQVEESLNLIGKTLHLRTATLIGGANMAKQVQAIRRDPHVIIATPGRLNDHLEQKTLNLSKVKILVLDEADRMLDMGFKPQIEKALRTVPRDRQTMLFSASMPSEIIRIADAYMKSPVQVEVAPSGTTAETVSQEIYFVHKEGKLPLLQIILADNPGSVLIFSRTKHGAKKIALAIRHMGHSASEIHSNKSLNQRIEALDGFKKGQYRVLVATDIAARGIDVKDISLVINFDLPDSPEDYVHRIGRTGRAQHIGKAISFATNDQKGDIRTIERLIKKQVPIIKTPDLPARTPVDRSSRPELSNQSRDSRSNRAPRPDFSNNKRQSRSSSSARPNSPRTAPTKTAEKKFSGTAWDDRLMNGPKKYKSPSANEATKTTRYTDRPNRDTRPSRPSRDRRDPIVASLDKPFGLDLFADEPVNRPSHNHTTKPQRSFDRDRSARPRRDFVKKSGSGQASPRGPQTNLAKFRRESQPDRPRFR